jgi:inorganic pyrophosphatase/exopolyphosphatase
MNNERNYVTSYPNPDTDGVACSIALAKLLTILQGKQYTPVIFGRLNNEASYVLSCVGLNEPTIVNSLERASSIALVDTHHKAQLPENFPLDKVEIIIDHHPNGDDDLFPKAKIDNRKIGAAASIIAEMYFAQNYFDKQMLTLLGFAVLSNTLNFSAPSTSDFDLHVYKQIVTLSPISNLMISDMFSQRSDVLNAGVYSALLSDFKVFETKRAKIGIAQLEIYDLRAHIDLHEVVKVLNQISEEKELQYCMFNGVDLKTKGSIVVCANIDSSHLAEEILGVSFVDESAIFDRILLRKTDFIPPLNQ